MGVLPISGKWDVHPGGVEFDSAREWMCFPAQVESADRGANFSFHPLFVTRTTLVQSINVERVLTVPARPAHASINGDAPIRTMQTPSVETSRVLS